MNSTAKKFISASVLSTLLFSAWPLRLGDQHENRGADVASHEEAEQRRGERKAVLEGEDLGGVGGAEQLGHGPIPSFDRLPFRSGLRLLPRVPSRCVLAHMSETGPKCSARMRPSTRSRGGAAAHDGRK